ncbi:Uncharacterised protein [uncultured archaeon]|nr:Uncharacterised protein [uncultured archaeon]
MNTGLGLTSIKPIAKNGAGRFSQQDIDALARFGGMKAILSKNFSGQEEILGKIAQGPGGKSLAMKVADVLCDAYAKTGDYSSAYRMAKRAGKEPMDALIEYKWVHRAGMPEALQ